MSLMGCNSVYQSLMELFPQIDSRILRAVAIEHPKDADEAAAVVIAEIVPLLSVNSSNKSQSGTKASGTVADCIVERDLQNGALTGSEPGPSSLGTLPLDVDCGHETRAPSTELLTDCSHSTSALPNDSLDASHTYDETEEIVVPRKALEKGHENYDFFGDSVVPSFVQAETRLTSNGLQGAACFDTMGNEAEATSSTVSEEVVHKLDYPADNTTNTQKSSPFQFGFESLHDLNETPNGSLGAENSDEELSGSNLVGETSKGFMVIENGDPELASAFSSTVSRSTQGCNIDHLEEIIEDAKNNKRTLFTVMESVMNLMREVELQEKDAEKLKEDATRGGLNTLDKVAELRKILEHAKEANDMHAGEVYGERSILTTEVNELENRLINLSEERDKSLAVLDEMREILETRLAAALEMKKDAEQEKLDKEVPARKALAEQEAIMEKVVQESKVLQEEAEQNSKLREFLMDRGRIVDSLQGEISVICQDIRLLKEKFDNRVPLSKSISSSQTSCKLASSSSSMKSILLEKPLELESSSENLETIGNNKSPEALVNEEKDDLKELVEDGWDVFDKETEE